MPGRQRVSTDGTEVVKFNFITYRRYRRQITGLIGKPRTFSSNPTLLLSPRVPEPILQPLRWDAQPVGQAQKVNQERRPQDPVLDVAPTGDGYRRLQHLELPGPLEASNKFHVLEQRPVRGAADGVKHRFTHKDALV